jgi:proteasome lid subunit RPN8/RPN11
MVSAVNRTITDDDPSSPSATNHLISVDGREAQRIFFSAKPLEEKTRSELIAACVGSKIEVCGFITERDREIHYVANVHEFPRENFYMDYDEFSNTVRHIMQYKKDRILGIFHTHPNGTPWPTPRDMVGWPNPDLGWRYFVVTPRDVIEWQLVR